MGSRSPSSVELVEDVCVALGTIGGSPKRGKVRDFSERRAESPVIDLSAHFGDGLV